MRFAIGLSLLVTVLIASPYTGHAMWAQLSNDQLVETSDVIVSGELIGRTRVVINQVKLFLGVLKADEILKGEKRQTVVLLALPWPEGPRSSTDIPHKGGQKGVWCLREKRSGGNAGIYLADHPQRFLSTEGAADRIGAIRAILRK